MSRSFSQDSEAQAVSEKVMELRGEVQLLRRERQRLVDISNDLRGELREPHQKRLAPAERRKLLEAALRALVAENRQLQQEARGPITM